MNTHRPKPPPLRVQTPPRANTKMLVRPLAMPWTPAPVDCAYKTSRLIQATPLQKDGTDTSGFDPSGVTQRPFLR